MLEFQSQFKIFPANSSDYLTQKTLSSDRYLEYRSVTYVEISRCLGYWFVHCHVGNHQAEGMALMFNESFVHQPPAPPGFPTCQKFDLDHNGFRSMLERNKKCLDDKCSLEDPGKKDKQDCQV